MAAALLVTNVWGETIGLLRIAQGFVSHQSGINPLVSWTVFDLIFFDLPLLCLAVFLSFGLISPDFKWIQPVFKSRARFIKIAAIAVIAIRSISLALLWREYSQAHILGVGAIMLINAADIIWPLALVALVAWLMPARIREAPKLA